MLKVIRQCKGLNPWNLIVCPVCQSREFTSIDHASVWCDECNAQFLIRSTNGDPGFVVDCHTENVHRGRFIYTTGESKSFKDRGWKIPKTNYLYAVVKTCEDPSHDARERYLSSRDEPIWEYWKGTLEQCVKVTEPETRLP